MGRHLKLGEIIWQTKQVPLTNLFSYTYPDFPFINSHWLFEVWAYLTSQIFGLQSLLILKLVIILTSVWLVLSTIPKKSWLLLPVGFVFLYTLRERPELRPEIFSFLFTALTLFILDKFEKTKTKLIYLLPIVQLLWINTHIYFIVGLVLQTIFLINFIYTYLRSHSSSGKLKLSIVILLLSIGVSFINPSNIKGVLNPLTFNQKYGYTIVENHTMFWLESIGFQNPNFIWVKLSLGIAAFSIFVSFLRKKFNIKNILLTLFGSALPLMNVRSFPYLALISLPAVIENFGISKSRGWQNLFIIISAPILLFVSFLNLSNRTNFEFKENAKEALDFVLENNLPQPIFNNFDIGSYITYRGWPKYKIFVDGRPGEYPKEFFQNVYIPMQYDTNKFKEIDQKYGFKTIIFSITDQTPWGRTFLQNITNNLEWKTVYLDNFMIVLSKQI